MDIFSHVGKIIFRNKTPFNYLQWSKTIIEGINRCAVCQCEVRAIVMKTLFSPRSSVTGEDSAFYCLQNVAELLFLLRADFASGAVAGIADDDLVEGHQPVVDIKRGIISGCQR